LDRVYTVRVKPFGPFVAFFFHCHRRGHYCNCSVPNYVYSK